MARVTYAPFITEFAGSIGGITFQHNSSGNIVRLKPNTVVNPSAGLAEKQQRMSALVAIWPTLSVANKNLWVALAAAHDIVDQWGITHTLNGYQWFLSYNLNALSQGLSARSVPAAYSVPAQPDTFTLTVSAAVFTINFAAPWTAPTNYTLIYATTPLRQSSLKLRKSHFLIDSRNLGAVSVIDIKAAYEDYFQLTWATMYAAAEAHIIIRLKSVDNDGGYASTFSSAIIKLN